MIKKSSEIRYLMRSGLAGGEGNVGTNYLLEPEETHGKCRVCNLLTIEPGSSIGLHTHEKDVEIYYLLEGELCCTDNGKEDMLYTVDVTFTNIGESHSIVNKSDKPAKLLAIVIN